MKESHRSGKRRKEHNDTTERTSKDTTGERPVEMKGETLNEETGKFNPGDHDDRGGGSGMGC